MKQIKRKIVILRGCLAAGKSTTFRNLKTHKKFKDWVFVDFPVIRKMFDNNEKTQVELADKVFFTILKELIKTGKNIVTQETSEQILRNKIGYYINKNKYTIKVIVLTISPGTSYKRATKRSRKKGKKPRNKEEVYKNYEDRMKKLQKEKLFINTERFKEKLVVNKVLNLIEKNN